MKRAAIAIFLVLGFALNSQALTMKEVKEGYYACLKFLKMSHPKQVTVSNRTDHSLSENLRACHQLAHQGLAKTVENYREYLREVRRSQDSDSDSGSSTPTEPDNSCSSSISCPGFGKQCVDHRCQDINPPISQCDTVHWCAAGESCVSGVCH